MHPAITDAALKAVRTVRPRGVALSDDHARQLIEAALPYLTGVTAPDYHGEDQAFRRGVAIGRAEKLEEILAGSGDLSDYDVRAEALRSAAAFASTRASVAGYVVDIAETFAEYLRPGIADGNGPVGD